MGLCLVRLGFKPVLDRIDFHTNGQLKQVRVRVVILSEHRIYCLLELSNELVSPYVIMRERTLTFYHQRRVLVHYAQEQGHFFSMTGNGLLLRRRRLLLCQLKHMPTDHFRIKTASAAEDPRALCRCRSALVLNAGEQCG